MGEVITGVEALAIRGEFAHAEDSSCADGAAADAAQTIRDLIESEGAYDFAGIIVSNGDSSYGLSRDSIYTNYSTSFATADRPIDYGSVYGIVHNHP